MFLQVVMMYNRNVTRVEVYVERYRLSRDSVKGVIETFAADMVTYGCPQLVREILAPYDILEVPQGKTMKLRISQRELSWKEHTFSFTTLGSLFCHIHQVTLTIEGFEFADLGHDVNLVVCKEN